MLLQLSTLQKYMELEDSGKFLIATQLELSVLYLLQLLPKATYIVV